MSRKSNLSDRAAENLLAHYCKEFPQEVAGYAKKDIKALSDKTGIPVSGVKKALNCYERIYEFLSGNEVDPKKYDLVLYDAWMKSDQINKLGLEKQLTLSDILKLSLSSNDRNIVHARLASRVYEALAGIKNAWVPKKFSKKIKKKYLDSSESLSLYSYWSVAEEYLNQNSLNAYDDDLREQLVSLTEADFKKVVALTEEFKLWELSESDPIFKEALSSSESKIQKAGAKKVVSYEVRETHSSEDYVQVINKKTDSFSSDWKSYSPLKQMTNEGAAKKVDLGNGTEELVYVRGHVEEQGPKYKSISGVLNSKVFVIPAYQRSYE